MQQHQGDDTWSLVADIGGTNTRVALAHGARVDRQTVQRYGNDAHADLAAVLARYLSDAGIDARQITGVCVAAAGPVQDGVAALTNLGWRVDRASLTAMIGTDRVAVLNDLQAQGHAIGHIDAADLDIVIPQPDAAAHATKLVVGLGTGFNACPVFDHDRVRFVPPSEAGHVSLPTVTGELARLQAAMMQDFGFASVEEVLSGRGISYLHRALHGEDCTPAEIMARLSSDEPKACATGAQFVRIMGIVVGDLALAHLPVGGIYLVGGVTRAIAPYLARFDFAQALRAKGRFADFMQRFGVFVVRDDYAALTGCASYLSQRQSP